MAFVTSDGVELAYRDTGGSGPPLVMMHGWAQTQNMFRGQLEGLSAHRRVITFDHRGHGASAKPHHGYRIARLAADLHELIEALGLDRFDLLGWSMGASVAWSYIDLFGTSRISSLVLVDQPVAIASRPWIPAAERVRIGATIEFEDFLAQAEALNGPDGADVLRVFERTMLPRDISPALWEFVVLEVSSVPSFAAVPLLIDHAMADWRDVLPRIDVPTLVIGSEGSHFDPATQAYVASHVRGARLHLFTEEVADSHFPFLINPTAFNAVVKEFLEGR